jgi:hypothetical protein
MNKDTEEVYTSIKASSLIEELNNRHRNVIAANNKFNKPHSPIANGSMNKQTNGQIKGYSPPPMIVNSKTPPSSSPLFTKQKQQQQQLLQQQQQQAQKQQQEQQQQQQQATRQDDRWILIQKNTFTNWINEQLKSEPEKVVDLKQDLTNGVILIKLVNALQKQNTRVVVRKFYKTPQNQHQCLENISFALNAITEDGVKMVNIGNTDLYNGNLKLMLGLIWHLILRYQIGKTKVPAKKLILAWLNAILPQYRLGNLTSDLNNGLALA